jgi:hypothetical protein
MCASGQKALICPKIEADQRNDVVFVHYLLCSLFENLNRAFALPAAPATAVIRLALEPYSAMAATN